ncbi:MAG: leucine-rich repeat protein, partial [Clostridia bacterium]|nr:leucine-rich repeat protein [Clostridia bacterium]
MRKGKKITFLVTILCALALLISWFSITPIAATALAEDTNNKVTATTTTTVKQGDTVNCYVYIDSLESLSSLNVAVHFDPDKVSVTSSFNSVSCSLYDSSINESYVQFSYIFDGNGEDTKAQLFYFQYKVLTNAEEGAAHFDVVVSEAYDSSLNVANISGSRCPFTIAKKVTNKTCTVSGTSSVTTAIKEEFELSYRLNTTGVASGSFVIRYDAELFEFVELSVGGLLENKFYDIKTDQPGVIYASFVGTEYASNAQLLTVKFKTIRNATQSSQIKLSVTDFYDLELNSIGCNGYTTNVHLTYDPTYSDDAPTMTVSTVYSAEKQQVTVTVKLDAGSYLGAGDFVLNFNTEYFTYNSATKGFVPTFFNINDKKASEGIVKFSIISLSDIVTEEIVLTVILDTPVFCNDVIADFDIGGNGLADSMTNPILINFVDSSLSISGVGHDLISHPAKAPTCTEIGWYAYDTCSRCDYTTYVEIPANGHRYVHTLCSACGAKQPTYQTWDVSANGDGSLMANLYENVVEGGYELELSGSGVMKDWVSPSDTPWYYAYRTNIRYLLLEEGMTSIGVHAFDSMTALTDVTIPDSVKVIGHYAFYGCTSLASVSLPTQLEQIGDYAFAYTTALEEIIFNATAMADLEQYNYVFYRAGLNGNGIVVTIGKNVSKIPAYLFSSVNSTSENPKIIRVTIEDGSACTTIGARAFAYCTSLESIELPEGLSTIGSYAFYYCTSLESVELCEGLTTIDSYAFYQC